MHAYRMSVTAYAILVFLCFVIGCTSGVDYSLITTDNMDKRNDLGIRYYETSPYLIVHSNPNGTLNVRIEHLPDPHKKMSVLPKASGATIETTLAFDNGALKSAKSVADATALPTAMLKAVEVVALGILDEINAEQRDTKSGVVTFPGPRIYKIMVRGDSVHLKGSAETASFEISLVDIKKKTKTTPAPENGGGA